LPDQKRQVIKRLLLELEKQNPGVKLQMLAALRNVNAGHLLDTNLWERLGLSANLNAPGGPGVGPDPDEVPV
jgi:tRNA(Ile)-lysidine synthase TilS/MesJ